MKKLKVTVALILAIVIAASTLTFAFSYEPEETDAVTEEAETLAPLPYDDNLSEADEEAIASILSEEFGIGEEDEEESRSASGEAEQEEEFSGDPEENEEITGETEETTASDETTQKKKGFSFSRFIFGGDTDVPTTDNVMKVVKVLRTIRNVFSLNFLKGDDGVFDVTMDDDIAELCNYMAETTPLDPYLILTNLPDITGFGFDAIKLFRIDTTEYRNKMTEVQLQAEADGDSAKALLANAAGIYFSGIESAHLYLVPMDNGDYEIKCMLKLSDGEEVTLRTDMYVNLETGEFYGPNGKGAGGIGFNASVYEGMVYAPMYCWMRSFGFCVEYDALCAILPLYRYSTRRFKFDYQDKEWMIQAWKGNYFLATGGEVGVYYRDKDKSGSYYDVVSDEDRFLMSLQIIHDDDVIVNIPEMTHWWVNGFALTYKAYSPANLTLKHTIIMRDEEMVRAFTEAIDKNIYHDVTYTVDGLKVTMEW